MRAAERARTSSRSSEEFTSSPISASVAKTSAEISVPVFVVCASVCAPVGFMDSLYYSRRLRACPGLLGGFPGRGSLLVVQEPACASRPLCCSRQKDIRSTTPSLLGSFLLEVASKRENTHVGQVPVAFGIVQPVTDDKFVGNREADVVGAHRCDAAIGLVQQHRDAQVLRLAMLEQLQEVLQRHPGI